MTWLFNLEPTISCIVSLSYWSIYSCSVWNQFFALLLSIPVTVVYKSLLIFCFPCRVAVQGINAIINKILCDCMDQKLIVVGSKVTVYFSFLSILSVDFLEIQKACLWNLRSHKHILTCSFWISWKPTDKFDKKLKQTGHKFCSSALGLASKFMDIATSFLSPVLKNDV